MPMLALVEAVGGSTGNSTTNPSHTAMPGTNCVAANPVQPLPMELLDSLSVHSKMSLIHSIVTHILKQVRMVHSNNYTNLIPHNIPSYQGRRDEFQAIVSFSKSGLCLLAGFLHLI